MFLRMLDAFRTWGLKHLRGVMGCPGTERHACRFVLQPGSVPEQHRLAAQMGVLREQCRDLDSSRCCTTADDFADISLVAEDQTFRWGRAATPACMSHLLWCTRAAVAVLYLLQPSTNGSLYHNPIGFGKHTASSPCPYW